MDNTDYTVTLSKQLSNIHISKGRLAKLEDTKVLWYKFILAIMQYKYPKFSMSKDADSKSCNRIFFDFNDKFKVHLEIRTPDLNVFDFAIQRLPQDSIYDHMTYARFYIIVKDHSNPHISFAVYDAKHNHIQLRFDLDPQFYQSYLKLKLVNS